jgi:3-hydroxymyristoyl/3-hydroxydecanoyl-(acyl carrier protein) dehydratase
LSTQSALEYNEMSIELKRMPLYQCALGQAPETLVALYHGQWMSQRDFNQDVTKKAAILAGQPEQDYALYYNEAYPFAVMLFALWHSGKSVWMAANNKSATAEKLRHHGCFLLGDWPFKMAGLLPEGYDTFSLSALDSTHSTLTLFTSGSSGEPQAIQKALWQLQNEVDVLEQLWGSELSQSEVSATVSHQHIYGLLFKVLWPLSSGRCFHSRTHLSPEALLKATDGRSSYWVASPAQLKRLDDLAPWPEIRQLKAIFSSGGILDVDVAKHIEQHSGQKLIDIYGSSETGGIAWRKPVLDEGWQTFPGVEIKPFSDRQLLLSSTYLHPEPPCYLSDRLEWRTDGRFELLGRMDRIVKVEEKRLSLNEMEQALQQSEYVEQAHCRLWENKRMRIAAVIELTPEGLDYVNRQGRRDLIERLRHQLLSIFEPVLIPKKWLLMKQMMFSAQSKLEHDRINNLLSLDSRKFPQLQYVTRQDDGVELSLLIQADLAYFSGHFTDYPILPGVTQLLWAERYGKLFFSITQPFSRMEVIKFKKIVRPDARLKLRLKWKEDSGKLYFDFSSSTESHSSGRLLYGANV